MKPKTPIRLSIALLKHVVSTALGEEALQVLAEESFGEVQDKLDAWLDKDDQAEELSKVTAQADACFGRRVQDDKLQQWMHDLPLRDLPALQAALDVLPEQADESELEEAITVAMKRDWPELSETQRDGAVRLYLLCLRRALLPLEEQALSVIGRSVLRTEERLYQLQSQLEAWVKRERGRCERAISIYGGIYQSIIVSGDKNVIHYNVYFVGDMWEKIDDLIAGGQIPALSHREFADPVPPDPDPESETVAPKESNPVPERPPIPDPNIDLREALARGEVCAFVGAGFSMGAGLPGWYDLISALATRIDYPLPPREYCDSGAMLKAAQAYINRQGLHSLIAQLKSRLSTVGLNPSPAHRALAELPINVVFTANYDDLLERSYRDAGVQVHTVVWDADLPFLLSGPVTVNIIKLYGDLSQPQSIVLASEQYEAFFRQRPQMVDLLETKLSTNTLLYLGWSHSDPHYNLLFGQMLDHYGKLMRSGYAAMFDVDDYELAELDRKHISAIRFPPGADRTGQLAAWLRSLVPPSS